MTKNEGWEQSLIKGFRRILLIQLKTTFLIIGVLVALIGISLMSAYGLPQTINIEGKVIACVTDSYLDPNTGNYLPGNASWSLLANLTAGDIVRIVVRQNALWQTGTFEPEDDYGTQGYFLYMSVDLTPVNPQANRTMFLETWRLGYENIPGQSGSSQIFAPYNVSLDERGVIDVSPLLDNNSQFIAMGGKIPFNGTYEVRVHDLYPPRNSTELPSYIGLTHNVTDTVYPNTYFLPLGEGVAVFGGVVFVVGIATGRREVSVKKRKLEKAKAQ